MIERADKSNMLALSIRQPYAELILRGIKTIEYRSRVTRIVGQRFYLYAAKKKVVDGGELMVDSGKLTGVGIKSPVKAWSNDLHIGNPPAWMVKLARQVGMIEPDANLPTGVIVGSAIIASVSQTDDGMWRWHLSDVQRAKRLRKPTGHPQPSWFRPF